MSYIRIPMKDGSTVVAMVKPGAVLTEQDKKILADFAEFCREQQALNDRLYQRKRNAKVR